MPDLLAPEIPNRSRRTRKLLIDFRKMRHFKKKMLQQHKRPPENHWRGELGGECVDRPEDASQTHDRVPEGKPSPSGDADLTNPQNMLNDDDPSALKPHSGRHTLPSIVTQRRTSRAEPLHIPDKPEQFSPPFEPPQPKKIAKRRAAVETSPQMQYAHQVLGNPLLYYHPQAAVAPPPPPGHYFRQLRNVYNVEEEARLPPPYPGGFHPFLGHQHQVVEAQKKFQQQLVEQRQALDHQLHQKKMMLQQQHAQKHTVPVIDGTVKDKQMYVPSGKEEDTTSGIRVVFENGEPSNSLERQLRTFIESTQKMMQNGVTAPQINELFLFTTQMCKLMGKLTKKDGACVSEKATQTYVLTSDQNLQTLTPQKVEQSTQTNTTDTPTTSNPPIIARYTHKLPQAPPTKISVTNSPMVNKPPARDTQAVLSKCFDLKKLHSDLFPQRKRFLEGPPQTQTVKQAKPNEPKQQRTFDTRNLRGLFTRTMSAQEAEYFRQLALRSAHNNRYDCSGGANEESGGEGEEDEAGTLSPRQYLQQLRQLYESNVPMEYVDYYSFVTKVQIRSHKPPISFAVFVELSAAGALNLFEEEYKRYLLDVYKAGVPPKSA